MMQKPLLLLLLLVAFLNPQQADAQYCTPSYSGNGHPQTGQPTPFFTHILRVSMGNIDKQTVAPNNIGYTGIYDDYTDDTIKLTQTAKYPLTLELGNGANTQTVAIWIDFNQNGVFESVERVFTRTDIANVGNHTYNISVEVPKNAVVGNTRMRIGTLYGTTAPNPCSNSRPAAAGVFDWSQHFQDYSVEISQPTVQLFRDLVINQATFSEVKAGTVDNEILRIDVTTNEDGVLSPLSVDSFYFNLLGSTNPDDLKTAKLYYTGKNPVFSTANLEATENDVFKSANGFVMTSTRKLQNGTNYFWLAVETDSKALLGNVVDAQCVGIHMITKRVPNIISPAGSRMIGYCQSNGNRSMFVYVRRVNFGNINVFSGFSNTGYSNYQFASTTAARGDSMLLTIEIGNGVNNSLTKAWIDFNGDGDFDDAGEEVLFDSITVASPANFTFGPVTAMVYIPPTAKVGATRMRVSTGSRADAPPYKPAPEPCDRVVEIGEVEDFTVNIYEDGEPVSDFSFNTVCLGDSTTFRDASFTYSLYSINSWFWDFGDGDTSHRQNPKHLYKAGGVYKVMLVANTNKPGTPDTTYKIVNVEDPTPNFRMSSIMSGAPIYFTDATIGARVVSWEWNFGDSTAGNNMAYIPNPDFEYSSPGSYKIVLKIRTLGGCEDSVVKTVNIVDVIEPVANFNAEDFEPYRTAPITMQDLSVNKPTSWLWRVTPASHSFVSNTSSSSQNPVITFNNLTTYKVTLVVENLAGKDSILREFKTKNYQSPVANFSANQVNVKAGQIVSFLDLSTNDPTKWEWVFGDGDTSRQDNPVHQYILKGKYSVKLSVENPAGKDDETKIDYITVSDEYVMCESDVSGSPLYRGTLYDNGGKNGNYSNSTDCGFLIKPSCAGPITIAFNRLAMATGDYVKIYDGTDNTGTPLHSGLGFTGYISPGTVRATSGAVFIEQITDASVDTTGFEITWSATPNIRPRARILADTFGYVNSVMIAENTTTIGTGNTYYWDWDNDGIIDDTNSTQITFLFKQAGLQKIKLIAVNCKGADTAYHSVWVDTATAPPVSNFTANSTKIFAGDEVTFTDLSSNGPNDWYWEISGDPFNYMFTGGTDEFSRNPTILFFEPGYYTVSMIASNDLGSGNKVLKNNYILVQIKSQMCIFPYEQSQPAGRITDDGGEDDPYSSTSCNFLINPCAKEVVLEFKQFDYRPGDFLRVYDGTDATGTPLHPGTGFTFGSTPGRLVATSGAMYIEHQAGTFNTNYQGFVADWSSIPYPEPELDFELPALAYTGGNIVFVKNKTDEKGNPFINYYWDFNNNGIVDDSSKAPLISYSTPGNKTIEMLVVACEFRDSITRTIQVRNPTGKPDADFEVSQTRVATTDVVHLTDLSTNGPGKWKWIIEPATYTIVANADTFPYISVRFNEVDSYTVTLIVENNLGIDTLTKPKHIAVFEYCVPTTTSAPITQIGISYVGIGDISNSSLIGQTVYTDYTETVTPAQLTSGGKHPIRLARNFTSPAQNWAVWIDFNQDGIFADSNELVVRTANLSTLVVDDTVYVPVDANYGITRMRIGASFNTDTNTPCGPNGFGEFEDYRVIIGEDKVKPIITLLGNPVEFIELGETYVDSGATAWDNADGDITSKIVVVNNVNIAVAGNYTVTYNVTDVAGNKANQVVRTVIVGPDVTKPIITLLGDNPLELPVFETFVDPGATAMDNFDGDVTANLAIQVNIDTARVGSYEVIYSAYDNSGNAADAVIRVVEVVDTVKPVITLNGDKQIILKKGEAYTEAGAVVTDNYYNDVDLIISGNVNVNVVGTYERYYDATDRSSNSAVQKVRTIIVEDDISIDELAGLLEMNLFPNPAQERINLIIEAPQISKSYTVAVINSLGQEIFSSNYTWSGSVQEQLNVSHLSGGIYFLRVSSSSGMFQKEFTIVK